jgi:hypothetical protein
MITESEYVLWCACRLKNKYAEDNDIWTKLYHIGEHMNHKELHTLEEQKQVEERQKVVEELVNLDYSFVEDFIK